MKIKLKKIYIEGELNKIYKYIVDIKETFNEGTKPKEIDIKDISFYNDYFFNSQFFIDNKLDKFKEYKSITYVEECEDVNITYIFERID